MKNIKVYHKKVFKKNKYSIEWGRTSSFFHRMTFPRQPKCPSPRYVLISMEYYQDNWDKRVL